MTRAAFQLLALIPLAYLSGSIPFGLIVGLAKGVDPRKAGSGNIGATNVGRLLGVKYFALVFTLDLLKGAAPMAAAGFLLAWRPADRLEFLLWILVGIAAVLGHMFSLFLKFSGGKGVATTCGIALGLFPYCTLPALPAVAVWIIFFLLTRYVSVASIAAAIAFPIAYVSIALGLGWPMLGPQLPLLIFTILVPMLLIYRHRGNIARLRAGTEHRFAKKSE